MALARAGIVVMPATSAPIFFLLAVSFFCQAFSHISLSEIDFNKTFNLNATGRDSGDARNITTMLLPLYLSSPIVNSSSAFDIQYSRRHLKGRLPNARMYLHDDLLLNGYYTTRLWIGTPPQQFALIVDTGSTVTYVPCSTCEQCGKHQDPRFQPDLSSTYQALKCNIECTCDNERDHCIYERQYAEMSSSSGILVEDILSFGNLSDLAPQRAVFGCENVETGDLYSQHADGIMGLGRGDLSIVDQLVDKGYISDSFSLCYGGMDVGGGAMVLGGISTPSDMVYSISNAARSPYYNIELKEIRVAGKALDLDRQVFDRKHGTVLDSGTTYAYLPEEAFLAFKAAILKEVDPLKKVQGPDPNYNDICFSGAGSDVSQLSKFFPSVDMVFGNGQKYSLSPENYLFQHSKVNGAYCLGIFQNGKDPTTLLGGIIVRNTLVTYDREKERIGFWKTNCSDLWERLQAFNPPPPMPSGSDKVPPPPMPSSSNKTSSTADIAPSLAPTESPEYNSSGETGAGKITFFMSLSVNYSDVKPHTAALAEFLARELGVNASQVQLVTLASEGNGSLIKWAISATESADSISNATAMGIISRLAENRVHLPNTFGSYKFFDWNIEPPTRREFELTTYKLQGPDDIRIFKHAQMEVHFNERIWWRQHYLGIVVTVVLFIIIGLLITGTWFLWKRQQSVLAYKPVDSVIPEQELQPLQGRESSPQ